MQLSPNFTLEEMVKSSTATRRNFKEQFTPDELIIKKLTALCVHLLEPVRDLVKKVYPNAVITQTSGYRCKRTNDAVGGTDKSQHMAGEATDREMRINGVECNLKFAQLILSSGIIFDQMILEYGTINNPDWIHLSWDLDKKVQRNQILRIGHDAQGKFQSYFLNRETVIKLISAK